MRHGKILLSALLSLCMLLSLIGSAFAEVPGVYDLVEGGREGYYSVDFAWHSPTLLDEQTNQILTSLLGALSVQGHFAQGDAPYSAFALLLSGNEAITFDTLQQDDVSYLASPLLGTAIALPQEDLQPYLDNLAIYLQGMMETEGEAADVDADMISQMMGQLSTQWSQMEDYANIGSGLELSEDATPEETMEALLAVYDEIGLGDALRHTIEWIETELVPETHEGPVPSRFDAEVASAQVYQLPKDKLVALCTMVLDDVIASDEYWALVIDMYNSQVTPDEAMTVEEIHASMPEMREEFVQALEALPDDAMVELTVGYDAAGEEVNAILSADFPETEAEGDEAVTLYMEWLTEGLPLCMDLTVGEEGYALLVEPRADDLEGFDATVDVIEADETVAQIKLSYSSAATQGENSEARDSELILTVEDDTTMMGAQLLIVQEGSFDGTDVTRTTVIAVNMIEGRAVLPVMTISAKAGTREMQGPAIDPAADTFVYPGQMDEEAFAAHMQDVTNSALQTVFTVLGMLPQDVLTLMMTTTETAPAQ